MALLCSKVNLLNILQLPYIQYFPHKNQVYSHSLLIGVMVFYLY